MDLISRQALMKEFSDFVRASNNSDFERVPTWNDAVSLVGSMPSAQQWIPCSERLPNPNEFNGNVIKYYLVQNVFGDMLVCNWNGKEWGLIYSYEVEMPEDVVAWMPLPEPYKGKDHETD